MKSNTLKYSVRAIVWAGLAYMILTAIRWGIFLCWAALA